MNLIDKMVSAINPEVGLKRAVARRKTEVVNNLGYGNHGASTKKNSTAGWITANASVLEDIEDNIEKLRERSRDLFMGAPIATGALKSLVTNIIGSGLKLNTQIDYEFLGMSLEEADVWETTVEREFDLWAESKSCDAQRMNNFYEIQQLAFLSQLMSGDCFTLTPMIKRSDTPYELTLQLVEADRVCNPQGFASVDNKIINGVEIDHKGEVVAYHIADTHPNSRYSMKNNWTRVVKFGETTGRPNVLHLMEMERPEQRRGVPILAPVIDSLKQLARYSDAELMSAVISAMFTAFVETELPPGDGLGGIPDGDQLDDSDDDAIELGNGLVNFLREGEKVSFANPSRPNTAFDAFVTSICRQIGVALEVPYEVLMKHFTSSYSASRGALLEAWKMYKKRREQFAADFCQPVYELFLIEAISKGRIYAPGFFDNPLIRKAYCGAEWNGPTQGQLDPLKEVNAAEKRVNLGVSTRTKETTELTGASFFKNIRLRELEEKELKRAGLNSFNNEPVETHREEVEKEDED